MIRNYKPDKAAAFKIFPNLGKKDSETSLVPPWPIRLPVGGFAPPERVMVPGVVLTPISHMENYHRYLERYGVQQMFSSILQDLYQEDPMPPDAFVLDYFALRWRRFLPRRMEFERVSDDIYNLCCKLEELEAERIDLEYLLEVKMREEEGEGAEFQGFLEGPITEFTGDGDGDGRAKLDKVYPELLAEGPPGAELTGFRRKTSSRK